MIERGPNNPNEMLQLAREGLTAWRAARERTAAERRAARTIAYAFGRLDEMARDGRLPVAWWDVADRHAEASR